LYTLKIIYVKLFLKYYPKENSLSNIINNNKTHKKTLYSYFKKSIISSLKQIYPNLTVSM